MDPRSGSFRYSLPRFRFRPSHNPKREWQALVADFKTSLDKFNVEKKEQEELFTIVGTRYFDEVESLGKKGDNEQFRNCSLSAGRLSVFRRPLYGVDN
jgi:hypothetical protein